ncbi:MAG: hypothetical protein ACKOAW_00865 [Actinomycetota bacterium]
MKTTRKTAGGMVLALALGIAVANAHAQTREAPPASDAPAAVSNKPAPPPAPDARGNRNPGQGAQQGGGGYNPGQSRPPMNNGGYNPGNRYPDFRSLIGMHGDAATQRLRDWGYRWAKTDRQGAKTAKYFVNVRDGGCALLYINGDRVRDAAPTDAGRCRQTKPTPPPSHHKDPHWGKPLPREISGLVGNKRDDAESKLASLGFTKVDAQKTQGKTYGLWWDRYRYECLEVEARDGRIRRIDRARRSACE